MRRVGSMFVVALVVALGTTTAGSSGATSRTGAEMGTTNWSQVSAGGAHSCGIRINGRLFCWGNDDYGQLGNGGADVERDTPVQVAGGATNWVSVTAGGAHSCGIRATGRLYCWGFDDYGQLGNGGADVERDTPTQVAGGATNWVAVSANGYHTCALRTKGRLFCWGSDFNGELGNGGANLDQDTPVQVAGGATNWTAVTAGGIHTCGRRTTGRLYCWGDDSAGEVGDGGTDTDRDTPTLVAGGATNWASVSASGYNHTCALRTNGRVFCWGSDDSGNLGNGGSNVRRGTPTQVAGGATNWAAVTANGYHTCALRTTGRLFCWGGDFSGELGNGGANLDQDTPTQVVGGATNWTSVSSGANHTCGRRATGRLYCWGDDNYGRLGNGGANIDRDTPVEIAA